MNEDPKKIWVDHTILCEFDMELCPESDVEYIRADLVYELMSAFREWMDTYTGSEEEYQALTKIEDVMFALEDLRGDA